MTPAEGNISHGTAACIYHSFCLTFSSSGEIWILLPSSAPFLKLCGTGEKDGEQQAKTRFTRVGVPWVGWGGTGGMGLKLASRLCFCASRVLGPNLVNKG